MTPHLCSNCAGRISVQYSYASSWNARASFGKAAPRNADGVCIVRLTSHPSAIKEHILGALELRDRLKPMCNSGCQADPDWANGAVLLVPTTKDCVLDSESIFFVLVHLPRIETRSNKKFLRSTFLRTTDRVRGY